MIFGKLGGNFDTDEAARQIGDLQTTVDTVVVSESDKSHPLLFQSMIKAAWSRVAIGKVESAKEPLCGSVAKPGVKMEIDFSCHPNFCGKDTSPGYSAGKYLDLNTRRLEVIGDKFLVREWLPVLQSSGDRTFDMGPNRWNLAVCRMNPDPEQRSIS